MATNGDNFSKIINFYKKGPNFMPGFRAVFEKICRTRTHAWTDKADSIGPVGLQSGTNNYGYMGLIVRAILVYHVN